MGKFRKRPMKQENNDAQLEKGREGKGSPPGRDQNNVSDGCREVSKQLTGLKK